MSMMLNRLKCRFCEHTVARFTGHGNATGVGRLWNHVQLEHGEQYCTMQHPGERLIDPLPWNVPYFLTTYRYDSGYRWALHLCDAAERLTTVVRALRTYAERDAAAEGAQYYAIEHSLGHGELADITHTLGVTP